MALTITPVRGARSVSGTIREEFYDVTFDNSYPTGGEAVTPRDFGLLSLYGIGSVGSNTAAIGYRLVFNTQTSKLYVEDGGTEPNAATDLSALTFRVRVTGI